MKTRPLITIVVVQRERFSYTEQSLEGIYNQTRIPFELIYIDAGSPRKYRDYLKEQSKLKGFELVRINGWLTPSRARNLGQSRVTSRYVVFIDNDIRVSPGWLTALLACAEETDAAVVCPLILEHWEPDDLVHYGGGDCGITSGQKGDQPIRKLYKKNPNNGQKAAVAIGSSVRQRTGLVEFHCCLIRTDIFFQVGGLDEALHVEEHTDFCIRVKAMDATLYFEPKSIVTYVTGPLESGDYLFYMVRWSDAWQDAGLKHLQKKWQVDHDAFFTDRYKRLRFFREKYIIRPIVRKIGFGKRTKAIEQVVAFVEYGIGSVLVIWHAWLYRSRSTAK